MSASAERLGAELAAMGPAAFTAADYRPGEVVHIVLFRYGTAVSAADRAAVRQRFLALEGDCVRNGRPYIREVVGGEPNGGEAVERGFEDAYVLRFASEGDRNFYCGTPVVTDPTFFDPAHQRFKEFVGPLLGPDGVLVFDFAAGRP